MIRAPTVELRAGVVTNGGRHEADVVVLAAGLGVPGLAAQVGAKVPLMDKPGTLTILTQPMPHFLDHILVTGGSPPICKSCSSLRLIGKRMGVTAVKWEA